MLALLNQFRLPPLQQYGGIVPLLAYVLAILVLLAIIRFFIEEWRKAQFYSTFPSMPGFTFLYWIVGNVEMIYLFFNNISRPRAIFRLLDSMCKIESLRGQGIFSFCVGFRRMVMLMHESTIEELITSPTQIDKSVHYSFFSDWLGQGLLTSTGALWKLHRKLLTPAFHFRILDSFVPTMNENASEMLDVIERDIGKKEGALEEGLDIRQYITNCTLDTICETAMGTRVGAQSGDLEYVSSIHQTLDVILTRMITPLYQLDFFWNFSASKQRLNHHLNKIHTFAKKVIHARREEMKLNIEREHLDVSKLHVDEIVGNKRRHVFLDSLLLAHLQDPKTFTMQDILDEVNTFMFEGHDTTSSGLIFTLMLIAGDAKVQEQIHDELMSVLHDDAERAISIEDARQMKYLEMVIKEGLRLYPPVPFFARDIVKPQPINGKVIPVGSIAVIFPYFLHRDAKNFPNPEKFVPERWLPEAAIHKRPYAYMPFSAGPRNCIGQKFAILELKIVIATVVRRFHLQALTNRSDIEIDFRILLKADSPVMIRFKKRESN